MIYLEILLKLWLRSTQMGKTFKGKITKIHEFKRARGRGIQSFASKYIRVTFKMEDGSWAKTDLCPEYRNFYNWRKILRSGEGTVVQGMQYRTGKEINADSLVSICLDQDLFKDQIQEQVEQDKAEETGQQSLFEKKGSETKPNNVGDMYHDRG